MRHCRECDQDKPESEFYPRRLVCKVCFHKARQSQPIGRPPKPRSTHLECNRCKQVKPVDEFLKSSGRLAKPIPTCKICAQELHRQRVQRNHTRNVRWVMEYLKDHPCADCGEADPLVLEFDHDNPKEKRVNVANLMVKGVSLEALQAEVAKCTVRCANCHRRKHARLAKRDLVLEIFG